MQDFNLSLSKQKLLDTNARSLFINAHPQKSLNKIDILSLCDLKTDLEAEKIIYSLFSNIPFKYSFRIDLNQLNKSQKRLLHLLRRNNDFKNELNLNPFGIGYPLVELLDQKNKRILSIPILIWDLEISGFEKRSGLITISRKSNQNVEVNPSLVGLIRREYKPGFTRISAIRERYDESDLKKNINYVLDVLGIKNALNSYWFDTMDRFEENTPKFNPSHMAKVINNGVLGLYANSKESLLADYSKLEEKPLPCHFTFPKDQNHSLFAGLALDHSQQRVIRSINQKKNIVIHGPPGTGKSKTLTASIVYLLSKGYCCLIVCEKKTAIDVLYQNMKSLALDTFCVRISEVRKDRREVVNKARDIIENLDLKSQLFLDKKITKHQFSKNEKKAIALKMDKVNEVITLINKTKKRLNKDLLGVKNSYSDLVIYVKTNRYKELTELHDLDTNLFHFSVEEYNVLQQLLEETTKNFYENYNPFQSIYMLLNPIVFNFNQEDFFNTIKTLNETYYEKLIDLQNRLDASLVGKNKFAFKYMNYSEEKDETLWSIQNEFSAYFNKIKKSSFMNKAIENRIYAVDLKEKVALLLSFLNKTEKAKNEFNALKKFHFQYMQKEANHKILIKHIGYNKNFKIDFFEWYCAHKLSENFIDNFDFNGFEKGYHNIELDVSHINTFILKRAYAQLLQKRIKGISRFKKQSALSIEQFFAKKSTSKRKKLPLYKISNHESDVFKSFFPVCMTNPSSCASLFPMEKGYFDYVIFDESSQLRIEDTLTALLRGKKSIVSGDIHQLPPMDYFEESSWSIDSEQTQRNNNSLLNFAISQEYQDHYLDIHYRSKHPDLINFSNAAFYHSRLIPKPPAKKYKPIEFYAVKGNFINQINTEEAKAIVNYIETKIKQNQSVGVATFSLKQRDCVWNELELYSKNSLSFYKKLNKLKDNGFFVKNIENIQGEERDVIIMGTTYGLDKNETFKEFLGPINTKKRGHKLLNVIITRAIEKMVIFSSIPQVVISNYKQLIMEHGNRGKSILYAYLVYAQAISEKRSDKVVEVLDTVSQKKYENRHNREFDLKALHSFSSFFTEDVSKKMGEKISFQNYYKVGGYEFELALKKRTGKPLVIDINGKVAYNSYEDYIFDMDRCEVAKKSNHKYYRLWLSNFYNNPDFETNKIIDLMNK